MTNHEDEENISVMFFACRCTKCNKYLLTRQAQLIKKEPHTFLVTCSDCGRKVTVEVRITEISQTDPETLVVEEKQNRVKEAGKKIIGKGLELYMCPDCYTTIRPTNQVVDDKQQLVFPPRCAWCGMEFTEEVIAKDILPLPIAKNGVEIDDEDECCSCCGNTFRVILVKEGDNWNDFGYRHCPFCGNMTDEYAHVGKHTT